MMWVNEMLTIWLWGTLFSLGLICFSLWKWYLPHGDERRDRDR
jgi:hypothetical protein